MGFLTIFAAVLLSTPVDGLSDPGIVILLGVLAPLLVSLLKRTAFPSAVNQAIAVVVAFAFAALSSFVTGGSLPEDLTEWFARFGVIFTLAQVIYRTYFAGTSLNQKLENLGG